MNNTVNYIFLGLFLLITLFQNGCQYPMANRHSKGKTIVCFGDSLTAGFGATKGHEYPSLLAKRVSLPVINAGISGNTAEDGLARVDKDVLSRDPKLVIITLGANDYMQQIPKEQTLSNMEKLIDKIKSSGAMVVWAAVQTGIFGDGYIDDFTKLARKERIMIIPNIVDGIMENPQYKHDQIHPNDEGYKIMEERIYQHIKGLLKDGELSQKDR